MSGKLTVEAGNALLKILEEPPVETLFVLICQHLGNLPGDGDFPGPSGAFRPAGA